MEKISKIIPPSRRTQYLDLAKRQIAKEQEQTQMQDLSGAPSTQASRLNAQRIEKLKANEQDFFPQPKIQDKVSLSSKSNSV